MKNSIKRAQSRAGSSFAERENFRPKVIQLKRTLLTLVALLALTTQAWAGIALGDVYKFGSQINFGSPTVWLRVFSGSAETNIVGKHTTETLSYGGYNDGMHQLSFSLGSATTFMYIVDDNPAEPWGIEVSSGKGTKENPFVLTALYDAPLIYHNTADDTWIVNVPAANVKVSVEYYDYAALASADAVTASTTAAATTDAQLVTVAEGAATGGTLMYYVTTDGDFAQDDALALAETAWSSDVPTAETISPAGGQAYVWYYIKGDDAHSDTDPVRLEVTVLPIPTYNVEFAEGIPEPDKWSATPNTDVKPGQKVTVNYTGTRKVIGVKAEKKAELVK